MLIVKLFDGSEKNFAHLVMVRNVVEEIGFWLVKVVLVVEFDGEIVGIDFVLLDEGSVVLCILIKKDFEFLVVMWYFCVYVMVWVVMCLCMGVRLVFGFMIDVGFYYDFDLDELILEDDFL